MTSDDSFYRAPGASLERPPAGTRRSLEAAMAGDFDIRLGEIFSEAWALTSGSKSVILGAMAISFAVAIANAGFSALIESNDSLFMTLLALVAGIVTNAITYTITAGVWLFAIKRAAGDSSAAFDDVISCFDQIIPIFLVMALMGILVVFGFVLLILPGIYLLVAYSMALPLKVERGLGVWDALETSRKTLSNCWFTILALNLSAAAILLVGGGLSLGVGLIWLLPFWSLCFGIVYREIFGYDAAGSREGA